MGRGWSLWRSVSLRGAGFPANHVLGLAMPEAARLADDLLALEEQAESARCAALRICEEGNRIGVPGNGSALSKAMKRLVSGQVPEPFAASPVVAAAILRFAESSERASQIRAELAAALALGTKSVAQVLRRAAADPAFRVAMLWQNPGVVSGTVDALLRKPAGATDSKTREHERLMASYLQRYCVKNDTIGFFGPVGWGSLQDQGSALSLAPGATLLSRRTTYFEAWGIQLLAATLAQDPELRPDLAPRRVPTLRLDGTTLHHSERETVLPVEYARLLAACDGARTAREIAEQLLSDNTLGLSGPEEVYLLLEDLVEKRAITWTLEVATMQAHPERALRVQLERVQHAPAKARALGALSELEAARDAITRACGDEQELARSLAELDLTFERLTGASAHRRGGEAYAGRTLVFEDCVRDAQLELGPEFVAQLAPPLLLLLQAARWYTYEVARRYEVALNEIHGRLSQESGRSQVELVSFLKATDELFSGSQYRPSALVAEVIAELRARWVAALALDPEAHRINRTARDLRAEVERLFAAPHPGWPGARYHSPDIMIAAASVAAAQRGEFLLVMGELHTGDNTASNPVFINQHPEPMELVRAIESDLPEPRIFPVVPRERSTRADQHSPCRHDFDVEFGKTRSFRARSNVLAVSDLVVENQAGSLHVRSRDGKRSFHALAFFEHYLKLESIAHFSLLPLERHSPRVTIDRLVVSRERWRFEPAELDFASATAPNDRFLGARRFARKQGLPRFVFVKIPEEVKPCFLDFDSPVFVELFCKLARRASSVVVSEMLPSVEETWLVDADGQSYTSELRFGALDPESWRPR